MKKFLELFSEKDLCWKNAKSFTETCLKPAVEVYVSKHLGQAIANHMKLGEGGVTFSTRTDLHFDLSRQLLREDSFQKYKEYTKSYGTFVKDWMKEKNHYENVIR